ncbi:hypothetical protein [Bacillus mycoides]|uniref:hypothetical protein n=1 Tax=Bacillus mycoides TaxID=1405 RepID=UPI003A807CC3
MLTVEDYCKWYDVFIIELDGTVTAVADIDTDIDGWIDHYMIPEYFKELAERLGAAYDDNTWKAVCGLYERDGACDYKCAKCVNKNVKE